MADYNAESQGVLASIKTFMDGLEAANPSVSADNIRAAKYAMGVCLARDCATVDARDELVGHALLENMTGDAEARDSILNAISELDGN